MVLTAARALLAEGGAAALSMRTLARRLGVAPNALYSHVDSKTQLIDNLLDDVLASIQAPSLDVPDPVAGLTQLMTSTYDVLTAHADLVPLYVSRQGARGPHAVRLGALMDNLLGRAGVTGSAGAQARRVLIVHTIGSAAFATAAPVPSESARPLSAAQSRRSFLHGLRWLLAGITQDGDHSRRRPTPRGDASDRVERA